MWPFSPKPATISAMNMPSPEERAAIRNDILSAVEGLPTPIALAGFVDAMALLLAADDVEPAEVVAMVARLLPTRTNELRAMGLTGA